MWTIEKIDVPSKHTHVIVTADGAGHDGVFAVGTVFSSKVIVAVPGIGYIQLEDKGNTVSGPGSWSVRVSNSSQNWFYDGTGHATLSFTQDGKYKITGGSNEISGPVNVWEK